MDADDDGDELCEFFDGTPASSSQLRFTCYSADSSRRRKRKRDDAVSDGVSSSATAENQVHTATLPSGDDRAGPATLTSGEDQVDGSGRPG